MDHTAVMKDARLKNKCHNVWCKIDDWIMQDYLNKVSP